jgi:hypothetical protein
VIITVANEILYQPVRGKENRKLYSVKVFEYDTCVVIKSGLSTCVHHMLSGALLFNTPDTCNFFGCLTVLVSLHR